MRLYSYAEFIDLFRLQYKTAVCLGFNFEECLKDRPNIGLGYMGGGGGCNGDNECMKHGLENANSACHSTKHITF